MHGQQNIKIWYGYVCCAVRTESLNILLFNRSPCDVIKKFVKVLPSQHKTQTKSSATLLYDRLPIIHFPFSSKRLTSFPAYIYHNDERALLEKLQSSKYLFPRHNNNNNNNNNKCNSCHCPRHHPPTQVSCPTLTQRVVCEHVQLTITVTSDIG